VFVPSQPSDALRASRLKISASNRDNFDVAGQDAPLDRDENSHTSLVPVFPRNVSKIAFSTVMVALYNEIRTYFIKNP